MYDYEKQNELKYDRPFALSLTAFSDNDRVPTIVIFALNYFRKIVSYTGYPDADCEK